MSSSASHNIKQREKANDIFITPKDLAKKHIEMVAPIQGELWLDPCRNNEEGSYYSQFPENKDWCEILEEKDFFKYEGKPDVIMGNHPYSITDTWFKKSIELNPRVISYIIGVGNLTARRIEWFEKAGYGLTKLRMLKVWRWYGMSYIIVFEKGKKSIIEIDRKVYR